MLLDYRMPGMDGAVVAERMSQNGDLVVPAVMMLTSDDYQAAVRKCSGLGIVAHVVKPVRAEELHREVVKILQVAQPDLPADVTPASLDKMPSRQNLSVLLAEETS